jgi:hypothetical protein
MIMNEAIEAGPSGPASGLWLIAGTPVGEPYPCYCGRPVTLADGRTFTPDACSPLWCQCSGRPDPQGPQCCAVFNTPERWKQANEEYQRRRAAGIA